MMHLEFELTVVIPVYNAKEYVADTLETLVRQTIFSKLEILIINDGSTDGSEKICLNFQNKYSNVHVYSQKNNGVSSARNLGIEMASAPYITFLDADDLIEDSLYENMLYLIKQQNTDIAVVDFDMVHLDTSVKKHRATYFKRWEKGEEALEDFFAGYIGNNVVDKIFRTCVVKNVEFPTNYRVGEDMYFVYQAILNANIIVMDTSICGYHYIIRDNSAMTSSFTEKYFDTVKLSAIMLEECRKKNNLYKYAEAHLVHEVCKVLEYMYRLNADDHYESNKKELRNYLRKYKFSLAKRYLSKKQFYGYCLMRLSPGLYMFMHKIMKIG